MEKWRRITDGNRELIKCSGWCFPPPLSALRCQDGPEHSCILMLPMSANESWENDLAWGSCVTVDSVVLRGAPQPGHIWLVWFDCDSGGWRQGVLAGGRHWVAAVIWRSSVLVREIAKRHASCHFHCRQVHIRCDKAIKLYGYFCWRLSDVSLHLSAALFWPCSVRARPTP